MEASTVPGIPGIEGLLNLSDMDLSCRLAFRALDKTQAYLFEASLAWKSL